MASSSSMVGFPVSAKTKSPSQAASFTSMTSSTVYNFSMVSFCFGETLTYGHLSSSSSSTGLRKKYSPPAAVSIVAAANTKPDPLRIMISGAPASGKGTQCELIVKKVQIVKLSDPTNKYGLMHIAAGDLLRAEVAAGTENGKQAKEFMEKGQLVPNEIVVMMVKDRLIKLESEGHGWLLDGYPRSSSQAAALEDVGIRPDLFILLNVPEEILVERVVGRRLDPVTGRIYHLKYAPPENDEIAARLTQRFDDTEEKVKLRLRTHHQNVEAVLSVYEDITIKVNGNVSKDEVFAQIDSSLSKLLEQKKSTSASMATGL